MAERLDSRAADGPRPVIVVTSSVARVRGVGAHALTATLAVLVAACVTSPEWSPESDLPSAVQLESVPFYAQRHDDCGAASLAMVLSWSGVPVEPEDLLDEVYIASRSGALPTDVIGASRRHGRVPFPIDDVDGLLREVAAGRPVLVLQKLGFGWIPFWHYAVVVGYDLEASRVVLHTGIQRDKAVAVRTFERTWRRADRWAQVILPPGILPVSAGELEVIEAGVSLEQVGRFDDAARLYEAAAARWPESLPARMGLGNARYASGDLPGAETAFRQAIALHPDAGPAYNNLAQVLLEQGDLAGARVAADRAVALGGPLSPTYRETRRAIDRALGPGPDGEASGSGPGPDCEPDQEGSACATP